MPVGAWELVEDIADVELGAYQLLVVVKIGNPFIVVVAYHAQVRVPPTTPCVIVCIWTGCGYRVPGSKQRVSTVWGWPDYTDWCTVIMQVQLDARS